MEMSDVKPSYTAGIDWGSETHAACILTPTGQIHDHFPVAHTAEGLRRLIGRLRSVASPAEPLRIAIERPSGLLVDTLLEAGFRVFPIHPNALKAARPRYSAAQGKSDPGDAYILADLLRTDGHRFRALVAASDATKALRAAVRTRDDLVATRVRLTNQLSSLLESFWPGPLQLFYAMDSPIALAFLSAYPTPEHTRRLGEKRLASFLKQHGYSGRRSAAELLCRLRAAPQGHAGAEEGRTKGALVRHLVAVLRVLTQEIRSIEKRLADALDSHPDGEILRSLPRSGSVNAAQILSELGEDRARFQTADQLSAEGGVAPVTKSSGKYRGVRCRFACNKHLRQAITTWADNSRHASPWAAHLYAQARARGCDHPHAIRILARAWTRVLWRCWQDHMPYDPYQHTSALPFLEPRHDDARLAA